MPTKNKTIIAIFIIIIIFASAGFYYWYFYKGLGGNQPKTEDVSDPFNSGNNKSGTSGASFSSAVSSLGDQTAVQAELPILRQISNTPVAGGISFKRGDLVIIRSADRGTGHIYETSDQSLETETVSNTTIPKVPESAWSKDGQSVIMRYLDQKNNILSFSANISGVGTTSQDISKNPKSVFLPSNISQLSVNPQGDKIFYLTNDSDGSIGYVSNFDGSQKRRIFQSPVQEWLVSWPNTETIILASKPSSNIPGYMFSLNSKTGATSKIIGGVNGLTAIASANAKNILYSESADNSFKLKYFNLASGDEKDLSFRTLPEKCVWSKTEDYVAYCAIPTEIISGDYPDDWYQGLASFTDSVWKVDVKNDTSELVLNIKNETGKDMDIINPFLSQNNDDYLFFMNKKDLTLWSLDLKRQAINKNKTPDRTVF